MTDDEINRRVAEIEGWHPNANSDYLHACWWFRGDERHGGGPPHYATDWAWCGPLIEKYRLEVSPDDDQWGAWNEESFSREKRGFAIQPTPQRAICLAVIAAHEGKG